MSFPFIMVHGLFDLFPGCLTNGISTESKLQQPSFYELTEADTSVFTYRIYGQLYRKLYKWLSLLVWKLVRHFVSGCFANGIQYREWTTTAIFPWTNRSRHIRLHIKDLLDNYTEIWTNSGFLYVYQILFPTFCFRLFRQWNQVQRVSFSSRLSMN